MKGLFRGILTLFNTEAVFFPLGEGAERFWFDAAHQCKKTSG
jgi:hypothetical protein